MTPLRRHMIEDMQLRELRPANTVHRCHRCVVRFARHFSRSPKRSSDQTASHRLLDMIEQQRQSWAYTASTSKPCGSSTTSP